LLLADPEQTLAGLKIEPLLSLPPDASEKEVFEIFDKYNLRMLTIVDDDNRPTGVVTVDDVVSKLMK
jgi:Mg/Co/Ni transporter MgtE